MTTAAAMTSADADEPRRGLHPAAWLLWAGGCTLAVATTRNPLYLALVMLCAAAAYRAARVNGGIVSGPRAGSVAGIVRVAAPLVLLGLLFNALTVHVGDRVLFRLSPDIPLIGGGVGGPITANALVFGAVSALAAATLILVFAAANAAVGHEELLRLLPAPLAGLATTLTVALGFLPQAFTALQEVREAQAVRGLPPPRALRDMPPLLLPVLALGLERALSLAEAMAARGYGMPPLPGETPLRRTRYRATTWGVLDTATATGAALAICAIVAFWFGGDALVYYPYPRLVAPPFALPVGLALAPLLLPALLAPFATPDALATSNGGA